MARAKDTAAEHSPRRHGPLAAMRSHFRAAIDATAAAKWPALLVVSYGGRYEGPTARKLEAKPCLQTRRADSPFAARLPETPPVSAQKRHVCVRHHRLRRETQHFLGGLPADLTKGGRSRRPPFDTPAQWLRSAHVPHSRSPTPSGRNAPMSPTADGGEYWRFSSVYVGRFSENRASTCFFFDWARSSPGRVTHGGRLYRHASPSMVPARAVGCIWPVTCCFLYIFGDNIRRRDGPTAAICCSYLACGLPLSALAHVISPPIRQFRRFGAFLGDRGVMGGLPLAVPQRPKSTS